MSFDKSDQDKSTTGTFDQTKEQQGDNRPFIVIGDRAFATEDDVVKFYTNANAHIEKIEQENKSYRERQEALEKAANDNISARELLEGIKNATTQAAPSETPSVSQEELVAQAVQIAETRVMDHLKSERQRQLEDENLAQAEAAAKQYYGDDYIAKINELAKEHGLNGEAVDNLAKQSPKAFAGLFLPQTPASAGPVGGDFNTTAFTQQPKTESPSFMKMTSVKDRAEEVARRIREKEKELNS